MSPVSQAHSQNGHAEHEAIPCPSEQRAASDQPARTEQDEAVLPASIDVSSSSNPGLISRRIRHEADRVRAKFMANVDTGTEVILRFDFMNDHDTRVAMFVVYTATFAGFIIFLVQFINIMTKDPSTRRFRHNTAYIWNVAVGGVCLIILMAIFAIFTWRILQACRQRKIWKAKRKRFTTLFLTEAAVQGINLVCYIAPNIYLLCNPTQYISAVVFWCGWIRWTCWNTLFMLFLAHAYGGQAQPLKPGATVPQLIMDGPWRWLWPCLLPWIPFQIAISLGWLQNAVGGGQRRKGAVAMAAFQRGVFFDSCEPDLLTRVAVDVAVGLAIVYFAVTCALIVRKLHIHKKLSWRLVQLGNVFFRLQLRLRVEVMLFFGLCLVLLWLVRLQSCGSDLFVSFGIMPMQVVMTANTFAWSFMCMPHIPQDDAAARRIWEQEFAWTEADKPIKLAARALTVPASSSLNKQPIFCFSTMMKMWYWSALVYDYQRVASRVQRRRSQQVFSEDSGSGTAQGPTQRTRLSLQRAMQMYDLTGSELFCELKRDTRCLMGWSHSTIILAFRGTASMTNALSDLQAWRVAHPPVRGLNCMFNRPLVHKGFLTSWLAGGFNDKVVSRTMEHVNKSKSDPDKLKIYITGHSLGGALATLAAYDICKRLQACGKQDVEVMCYSIGAPRTGNHAFAKDYNQVVPDTWSIINDQDVFTRGGKFLFLYKRPGRRVIVNDGGHMMVAPSAIEASVQQYIAGQSVDHHLLSSYQYAIMSIILAQFTRKGFSDGMEGMVRVFEENPKMVDLMELRMGMRIEEMRRLSQLSPEERAGQSLTGAHLPPRGFYQIRPQNADTHHISCFGLPFWLRTQSLVPDSSGSGLQRVSADSQLATSSLDEPLVIDIDPMDLSTPSKDQSEVTDAQSGELAGPSSDLSAVVSIK